MQKSLSRKTFFWVILVFFIAITPMGMGLPHESSTKIIAVGLGIDKVESGVEVSLQILVPQASSDYQTKTTIVSGMGVGVAHALSQIELDVGKKVGFAHINVIVVSSKNSTKDIVNDIEYFLKNQSVGSFTMMINTEKSAKEVLSLSSQIDDSASNSLQELASYASSHIYSAESSLHTFVNGYNAIGGISFLPNINVKEQDEVYNIETETLVKGSSSQSSSSGGSGSGSSGESGGSSGGGSGGSISANSTESSQLSSKSFYNDGTLTVFKKGKKVCNLTSKLVRGINWIRTSKVERGVIELKNVSDKNMKNANVALKIYKIELDKAFDLINNVPIIKCKMKIKANVEQIDEGEPSFQTNDVNQISKSIRDKLVETINGEIQESLNFCKEQNIDIYELGENLYHLKNKKWKQYLKTLDDEDKYLSRLLIKPEITVERYI